MKNVQVINLGETRELLAELDKARSAILAGHTAGFYAGRISSTGEEEVFLGGVFRENATAAVKSMLKAAAADARARRSPEDHPTFLQSMM